MEEAVEMTRIEYPDAANVEKRLGNIETVAAIYRRTGRYAEAAQMMLQALVLAADMPERLAADKYRLARCYIHLGQKDLARKYLTEVRDQFPDTEVGRHAAGLLRGDILKPVGLGFGVGVGGPFATSGRIR